MVQVIWIPEMFLLLRKREYLGIVLESLTNIMSFTSCSMMSENSGLYQEYLILPLSCQHMTSRLNSGPRNITLSGLGDNI